MKDKEVRLKQLEEVNQKIAETTNIQELQKLVATGKFLISIIEADDKR